MYMGCHSDSGYTHQPRGFYSQLVFDESFEGGLWPNTVVSPSTAGSVTADNTVVYQGHNSARMVSSGGSGSFVGVGNRGLGNEGQVFSAGKVRSLLVCVYVCVCTWLCHSDLSLSLP